MGDAAEDRVSAAQLPEGDVIRILLEQHARIRELFADASGMPLRGLGEGPFVQLWPHVHGTDAMFFALIRKI